MVGRCSAYINLLRYSSTSVNKVKRTRRWVQTNQTELMEEQQRMTAVGLGRHGDARYGRDDEEGSH